MSGDLTESAIVGDDIQMVAGEKPSVSFADPREILAVVLWTFLADIAIFRSFGLSGPAVFFATAVPLFLLARKNLAKRPLFWICASLLLMVAARLAWCGNWLNVASGIMLVLSITMVASGALPFVLESIVLGFTSIGHGIERVFSYRMPRHRIHDPIVAFPLSAIFLPLLAAVIFSTFFTLANPNLKEIVFQKLSATFDFAWGFFGEVSLWELPFCIVAFLIGAGLMKPKADIYLFGPRREDNITAIPGFLSPQYLAYRNTLITLIVLFAAYLYFEFVTLWRRDFPDGFYYAGYAHQGAAWLTVALALATVLLSWIFSGEMLLDQRHKSLKRLAWVWSAANLLLGIAVYNRLLIYNGYNGMTLMRTVGFFGTTLVIVGFILVLLKIRFDRGFWWLIRSQLIALVLTVIVYGLFPVDFVAHAYNARKVAGGYLHPSVMIAVKPVTDEGIFPLIQLVKKELKDPIIREGVLALLAQRQIEIEQLSDSDRPWHWTMYQASTSRLYRSLKANEGLWQSYLDHSEPRNQTIRRFSEYAMQWY